MRNKIIEIDSGLKQHRSYGALFEALDKLEDSIIDEFIYPIKISPGDNSVIHRSLLMRSLKSIDAIKVLCDKGYGEQAVILSRTIVEDMLVSWWTSDKDADSILDKLNSQVKSTNLVLQNNRSSYYKSAVLLPHLSDEEFQEIVTKSNININKARNHWTGKKMSELFNYVKPDTAIGRDFLNSIQKYGYLLSNSSVHNNMLALDRSISGVLDVRGTSIYVLSRMPSEILVWDTLSVSFQALYLLFKSVKQLSSEKIDKIAEEYSHCFKYIHENSVKKLGRNDECPCGSGKKIKNCHLDRW